MSNSSYLRSFLPTATKEGFKFTSKDVKKMKKVGDIKKEKDMYIPLVRLLLWYFCMLAPDDEISRLRLWNRTVLISNWLTLMTPLIQIPVR
jgi:hypothetical protein